MAEGISPGEGDLTPEDEKMMEAPSSGEGGTPPEDDTSKGEPQKEKAKEAARRIGGGALDLGKRGAGAVRRRASRAVRAGGREVGERAETFGAETLPRWVERVDHAINRFGEGFDLVMTEAVLPPIEGFLNDVRRYRFEREEKDERFVKREIISDKQGRALIVVRPEEPPSRIRKNRAGRGPTTGGDSS